MEKAEDDAKIRSLRAKKGWSRRKKRLRDDYERLGRWFRLSFDDFKKIERGREAWHRERREAWKKTMLQPNGFLTWDENGEVAVCGPSSPQR
jgi:hypothetical protein